MVTELEHLRDAVARIRRAQFRIVGTEREEALRAIVLAALNGAPLEVNRYLEAGSIVLAMGRVYFASEETLQRFMDAMGVQRG